MIIMKFNKELEQMLKIAEEMGIMYELNSSSPGFFITNGNDEIEIDPFDLFPELSEEYYVDGQFVLDEFDLEFEKPIANFVTITTSFRNDFSGAA
jgi:hypothetical protein